MSSIREFDLTGYEEKVYLALLTKSSSSVKEISKLSTVPPTAVYPNLQSLMEKGLVQRVDEDVQYYQAVEPKIALKHLLSTKIKKLHQAYDSATIELSAIKQEETTIPSPIQLTRGKPASVSHIATVLEKTTKTFYAIGWNTKNASSARAILKVAKELKRRKIDFRIIFTFETEQNAHTRKELTKIGIPYRCFSMGYFSLLVSDAKRCKITLKQKALPERLNMMIEDEDLSQAMHQYFLSLWKKAKKEF